MPDNTTFGSTYGDIDSRLRDTSYATIDDVSALDLYAADGRAPPEDAPWPAVTLDAAYDLHFVPRTSELLVWLVEDEYTIVAEDSIEAGRQFGERGPETVADTVRQQVTGRYFDMDDVHVERLADAARDAAAELFADPFDEQLRADLERPQARWIDERTLTVEAADGGWGRTVWTPTIAAGRKSDANVEWEPSYPTGDLTSPFSTGFHREFRKTFRTKLYFEMHEAWMVWFTISMEFLGSDVIVRGYDESTIRGDSIGDYQFRRSQNGTWHLQHRGGGEGGCQHANDVRGPARSASLDGYPAPSVLCAHCSRRLKELQASHTLSAVAD